MTLRSRLLLLFTLVGFCFFLIQGVLFYVGGLSFFLASLLGILGLVPIAYFLSWFATKPIREIVAMARVRISGDSTSISPPISLDDLGGLVHTLDEMAIQVKNKIEEVATEKDTFQTILSGMVEGVLIVDAKPGSRFDEEPPVLVFALLPNRTPAVRTDGRGNCRLHAELDSASCVDWLEHFFHLR